MNKYHLLFIILSSSFCFAQKTDFKFGFSNSNESYLNEKANYFETKKVSVNSYSQESQYSIYNPKPGFNATKTASKHFYSFTNTANLLENEMKNIKKEPIFPEYKQESLGEKIISTFITSILE
ncbi:hypothetical protein [Flavobacterium sp. PL11]|uniref:hypothetical protein n=1 Tax=Flavobacterium sp. PL11 TaxID=3071717 RepID=UPI002E102922